MAQFSLVPMPPTLLAVPNVSEGENAQTIAALSRAIETAEPAAAGARLLDVHSDADHGRSVFTFAGAPGELAAATLRLAAEALARIDLARPDRTGQHPHVGVLDVAPVVYLEASARGAACAEALVLAERLGVELELPVFLYGELTAADGRRPRTRAELRRGGAEALAQRMAAPAEEPEALRPDFGPPRMDPRRGATLVAARQPLVAFNVELAAPASIEDARRIAALVREGGAARPPGPARDRDRAGRRWRPGLDERRAPAGAPARRGGAGRSPSTRRSRGASWSASRPPRLSRAFPMSCRSPGSTPAAT